MELKHASLSNIKIPSLPFFFFFFFLPSWGISARGPLIGSHVSSILGNTTAAQSLSRLCKDFLTAWHTSFLKVIATRNTLTSSISVFKADFTRQQINVQQMTPLCCDSQNRFQGKPESSRWFTSGCLEGNSQIKH